MQYFVALSIYSPCLRRGRGRHLCSHCCQHLDPHSIHTLPHGPRCASAFTVEKSHKHHTYWQDLGRIIIESSMAPDVVLASVLTHLRAEGYRHSAKKYSHAAIHTQHHTDVLCCAFLAQDIQHQGAAEQPPARRGRHCCDAQCVCQGRHRSCPCCDQTARQRLGLPPCTPSTALRLFCSLTRCP